MTDKEYVYQCVLRTYGLDSARFEKICGDLRTNEISISFEENCLDGVITISKNNVDAFALESIPVKLVQHYVGEQWRQNAALRRSFGWSCPRSIWKYHLCL